MSSGNGTEKLFDGNEKQVKIGALPAIEVTRAAAGKKRF